jgi:hypothetical protein
MGCCVHLFLRVPYPILFVFQTIKLISQMICMLSALLIYGYKTAIIIYKTEALLNNVVSSFVYKT